MNGPGRRNDVNDATGALLANPRARLALGAGIVLILFFVLSIVAVVVLLTLSNAHGASIDSRMTAMEQKLFAGSDASRRSLQTNIEGFTPQLDDLKSRLGTIETEIRVLPQLNAQIQAIEGNTSPVARLPLLQADVNQITHQGLPTLTADIGTVIRTMQPISLMPSLASDISAVTRTTLAVLPRVDTLIAGMATTLDSTERHLIAMQQLTSAIPLMARDLSHMRGDIDSVTSTLSMMAGILVDVRTHVANLDKKVPGAPIFPAARAHSSSRSR